MMSTTSGYFVTRRLCCAKCGGSGTIGWQGTTCDGCEGKGYHEEAVPLWDALEDLGLLPAATPTDEAPAPLLAGPEEAG